MERVAIIGAGPGGISVARWLKKEGFEPVLFEQGSRLGGQWAGDPRSSGIWPSMRTNTSRVMTAFSDLAHAPGTPVYPTNQAMLDYLERYAGLFDLHRHIRFNTGVREIARDPDSGGWTVRCDGSEEVYPKLVIATGRFHKPFMPDIPGLASFSGSGGVAHTFAYKQPERFRGLRVVVAGASISALEVASDLAMLGAAKVIATNRRQRYVVQKLIGGVPVDHLVFTRFGALSAESMPPEAMASNIREFIVRSCGSPEQYGAAKPAEKLFEAGIALSQHFLPLLAEGRIEVRPWMAGVDGQTVFFADGRKEEVDAIIFGTGFDLDFPFLDDPSRDTIGLTQSHADLYISTFHPDLPGLAFVGIMEIMGPYFPLLELQARWIAYTWSGSQALPSREEMETGIAAARSRRAMKAPMPMHLAAIQFARAARVEPDLAKRPELARALLFGPLPAVSFRLDGRDSLPDAAERTLEAAAEFAAVPGPDFSPQQRTMLKGLATARGDALLQRLAG